MVQLGRGRYRINVALTCTDKPLYLRGQGANQTSLIQTTAGANGVTFTCTRPSNETPLGQKIRLQIEGLTFFAGSGVVGGTAIRGSWLSVTDTRQYCVLNDVNIDSDVYGTADTWAGGIHLTNINGDRFTNVAIHGDPLHHTDMVAYPFTMAFAIKLDGADDTGKINHLWSGITVDFVNTAVDIDNWYEGLYLTNFELAFVGDVFSITGPTTPHSSAFLLSNGHMNFRGNGLVLTRANHVWLSNVDVYKGAVGGTGYAGTSVVVTDSEGFRAVACKFTNANSASTTGINADANSPAGHVSACLFNGMNSVAINIAADNWHIQPNHLENCATGITLPPGSSSNQIDVQLFSGTFATYINDAGTSNFLCRKVLSGIGSASSAGTANTFPTPFLIAPQVIAIHQGTDATQNIVVNTPSTTGFSAYSSASGPVSIMWIAASVA
jgi:hypothetical protein